MSIYDDDVLEGELEYAGDEDMNATEIIQMLYEKEMADNDDIETDDDDDYDDINKNSNTISKNIGKKQSIQETIVHIQNVGRTKSRGSYGDENNLIDYVIDEEKEIGGAKDNSDDKSSTFSSVMNDDNNDDDDELEDQTGKHTNEKILAKVEAQMIRARAFLNRLDKTLREKDSIVKQARESVYISKEKLTKLEKEKDKLERNIETAQEKQNITITNRLCSEHQRLLDEIEIEHDVLKQFQKKLDEAEYTRTKALLERSKYAYEETELKVKEDKLLKQKREIANLRKRNEDWKVTQIKKSHLSALKDEKRALEEQAKNHKLAIEETKRSQKVANKYLQQTFQKVRDEKRLEEERSRNDMERKIKSLLNLRDAIEHNKDTLTVQTAQKRALIKEQDEILKKEQNDIENQGQNALFYLLRKQKNDQLKQIQQKFEEQQELNRLDIVDKLLKEQNEIGRKRKLYPEYYADKKQHMSKIVSAHPSKNIPSLQISKIERQSSEPTLIKQTSIIEPSSSSQLDIPYSIDHIEYASSLATSAFENNEFDDDDDADLAKPEFDGLWDKEPIKPSDDPLFNRSKHYKSKMDKDILQRTLAKLKDGIVREQVVGTKKFKGIPFKSDPKIIHFKDFDVGKTYRTKVTLTNVTLTINTLKLVGLSENLKDFIIPKFEAPGMISAGMSCYMTITFEPKLNEDLNGEIKFLAQTGLFTVPIQCSTKKCDLSLDKTSVDVGTTVVEEKLYQSLILKNAGALGTNYRLIKTNLLQIERENADLETKEQQRQADFCKPVSRTSVEKEHSTLSDTNKLIETEYVQVFHVKIPETGIIAAHASIQIEIEFSSPVAGKFEENYTIVFDDKDSPELRFVLHGQSLDVPVWIENPNIDFKICMFDRLYQEGLVLRNRSNAALRVTIDLPSQLEKHIEIVPKTAYIQAKSSFSLQIKLMARQTLTNDDTNYFDQSVNTLIIPLELKVADQVNV
ncbi:unnamed protein product, partial [Didymodactylos carnosus]